jgi:hypothetical protein
MTTASPLKAASALPPDFFGAGDNSDYAEKYKNAQDAEQKLMAMLEKRNQTRMSPSMLALAGELLDPGRTGSFGEALGRGAKAYANMQGVEEKQLAENAMMESQLRNMQLERAQAGKMANMAAPFVQGLLGSQQPQADAAPPAQAEAAAPELEPLPEGVMNARSLAAAQGKQPMPAAPMPMATPTVAGAPKPDEGLPSSKSPTLMINNRPVNAQTIAGLKMVPATRSLAEGLEYAYNAKLGDMDREYKERTFKLDQDKFKLSQEQAARDAIKTQPDYYVDVTDPRNPKTVPLVRPGEPDVEISFPEFGGKKMMGPKDDLVMLRAARNAKDAAKVKEIYDRLQFGVRETPVGAPTTELPPPAKDVASSKAAEGKRESIAKTSGENQAKETQTFLANDSSNRDAVFTSARILKNAKDNPQLFGILKKPGLGTALASFIRDKGEAGDYAITKENLEDFLRKSNIKTTEKDLSKVAEMSSDLARLHFNFRKVLLQGQGTVSDREDASIAKVQGTISEPATFLINMAQLTGRKAQFDSDVAADLRKYRRATNNPDATLEEFRSDPTSTYNKLLSGYENWLTRTYKLPGGLTSQTSTSMAPISSSSLDAEIQRRGLNTGSKPPTPASVPPKPSRSTYNTMRGQ